jgi:biopolymer transport protein ExbB/TolQ
MRLVIAAAGIDEALAQLASALRTPVLVLALLALALCALEAGRFLAEWWSRMRAGRGALRSLAGRALADPSQAGALAAHAPSAFAGEALRQLAQASVARDRDGAEHALADYELAAQRRLDRTRILVRAGPALGLMGTLIPLAPGLSALGHGDISTLAGDLRTAFAATTIGLLVGMIAYGLTLARTRMYSEDLSALEHAATAIGTAHSGRVAGGAPALAGRPTVGVAPTPVGSLAEVAAPDRLTRAPDSTVPAAPTVAAGPGSPIGPEPRARTGRRITSPADAKPITSHPDGPTGQPDQKTTPPLPAPRQ